MAIENYAILFKNYDTIQKNFATILTTVNSKNCGILFLCLVLFGLHDCGYKPKKFQLFRIEFARAHQTQSEIKQNIFSAIFATFFFRSSKHRRRRQQQKDKKEKNHYLLRLKKNGVERDKPNDWQRTKQMKEYIK